MVHRAGTLSPMEQQSLPEAVKCKTFAHPLLWELYIEWTFRSKVILKFGPHSGMTAIRLPFCTLIVGSIASFSKPEIE